MTTTSSTQPGTAPSLVRATQALENDGRLDGAAAVISSLSARVVSSPGRRRALRGEWLGHAVHPLMTDLPLGAWTSTMVLDLAGGEQSRPAARRLLAFGVLASLPTALTGLAEVAGTGSREKRVILVHAASNSLGLALYTASLVARRRGKHRAGVLLGLAGGAGAAVGGYLGAHLTEVRKVSSRHPAFVNASDGDSGSGR